MLTLLWKTTFWSELLILQNRYFVELVNFHCLSPNPYTRRCIWTIPELSFFREIVKDHCKLQVSSWFGGFSLISDFSAYFNYWILIRETILGTPPLPLRSCWAAPPDWKMTSRFYAKSRKVEKSFRLFDFTSARASLVSVDSGRLLGSALSVSDRRRLVAKYV